MMKKTVKKLGAAALALCMMLSMMISASAATKYYVKIEIADQTYGQSVSYTSPSVSKTSDSLAETVLQLLTANYSAIEAAFRVDCDHDPKHGPASHDPVVMGKVLRRGSEAYEKTTNEEAEDYDENAWSNWVTENYTRPNEDVGDLVDLITDLNTKVGALEDESVGGQHTMTYTPELGIGYANDPAYRNTYTFTVSLISRNVVVGGGSVPSTPSTPSDPGTEPGTTPDTPKDVVVDVPAATTPDVPVELPVEKVEVGKDTQIVVNTKSETPVKVVVPVVETTPGTVAVIVKADGTEQVIRDSVVSEAGVTAMVSDGDKIVIKDNSKTFNDVDDSHWGKDAVTFVASRELFAGVGNDNFAPDQTTNRAMVVQVLHNLEYNVEHHADGHDFHDVQDHHWYDDAVHWGEDHGVVSGYADGSFQGEKTVTREELVVMLWNYAGKLASEKDDHVDGFNDAKNVSDWAKAAMNWALENGVLGGKGGKMLDPTGMATRAEMAQMIKNFCENVKG